MPRRTSPSRTRTSAATSSRRAGRSLVAVNKWDALDEKQREHVEERPGAQARLPRLRRVAFHLGAQGHGPGAAVRVGRPRLSPRPWRKLPTPKLTRALQAAVEQQQPPLRRHDPPQAALRPPGRAQPAGGRDPRHQRRRIKDSYRRYLENTFVKVFKLKGTPLRIELRRARIPTRTRSARSSPPASGREAPRKAPQRSLR